MARTRIKNNAGGPITLPAPLRGILAPGKEVISSIAKATLDTLFNTANLPKQVRLTAGTGSETVTPGLESELGTEIVDAGDVGYTPTTTGDWPGTDPDDSEDALDRLAARTNADYYVLDKDADANAAATTAESVLKRIRRAGTITAARFVPTAAVTADASHYATLSLAQRDGAGGSSSAIASLATDVAGGSWTAFVAKSLGTLSNTAVAAGAILTAAIAKTGNGVVVPAGHWEVVVQPASGA